MIDDSVRPDDAVALGQPFDNAYARLPAPLALHVDPTPVSTPTLLALNRPLAQSLGLDADVLSSPAGVAVLAGSRAASGAEPLAMAYAGHQFGNWVPQLGDGRAILLGERVDADGVRREIQLKGAGRTPFSRGGDGRSAIGPVLREYLVSEAMHALGVPTTRALAAVATGEAVIRETALPGAILTRVARSHVRVGTFQFLAARREHETLRALLMHVLRHHYPELIEHERPAVAFLDAVIDRQAALVAHWMSVGFIHGVMNTDNCSVLGDTIDYGPCAFMDTFDAQRVFSSIDMQARYRWSNQPAMAHWNCAQLAQCLLPLIDDDIEAVALPLAQDSVNRFDARFAYHWAARLGAKIGVDDSVAADTRLALGNRYLAMLETAGVDFTLGFRALLDPSGARRLFGSEAAGFDTWWQDRCAALERAAIGTDDSTALLAASNPVRIPRNHRIEEAIVAAQARDLASFQTLHDALQDPFRTDPRFTHLEQAPGENAWTGRTFCGT